MVARPVSIPPFFIFHKQMAAPRTSFWYRDAGDRDAGWRKLDTDSNFFAALVKMRFGSGADWRSGDWAVLRPGISPDSGDPSNKGLHAYSKMVKGNADWCMKALRKAAEGFHDPDFAGLTWKAQAGFGLLKVRGRINSDAAGRLLPVAFDLRREKL